MIVSLSPLEKIDNIIKKNIPGQEKKNSYFSFADESKINSMLSETDRNREMCNQIVRRVFTDPVQTNSDQLLRPFGRLVSNTTDEFDYLCFCFGFVLV